MMFLLNLLNLNTVVAPQRRNVEIQKVDEITERERGEIHENHGCLMILNDNPQWILIVSGILER